MPEFYVHEAVLSSIATGLVFAQEAQITGRATDPSGSGSNCQHQQLRCHERSGSAASVAVRIEGVILSRPRERILERV